MEGAASFPFETTACTDRIVSIQRGAGFFSSPEGCCAAGGGVVGVYVGSSPHKIDEDHVLSWGDHRDFENESE